LAGQFDIVENRNPTRRAQYPFLVILQHDRVAALKSVVTAPLVEATANLVESRLHPSVVIAGRPYILLLEQLAAIETGSLGRVIGSAGTIRYGIVAALDLLFTGV
jgi:hypothetical protein